MTVTVYMEVGTGEVVDLVPWGQVEFSESTGSTTYGVKSSRVLVWKKGVKGLKSAAHGECEQRSHPGHL